MARLPASMPLPALFETNAGSRSFGVGLEKRTIIAVFAQTAHA
jgi:hypothetical protein